MNQKIRKQILIIEDSKSQRMLLKSYCEQYGNILVLDAADGYQGWCISNQKETLDLIIVDLNLPKMDGIQLIEKFARRPQIPAIIIISEKYSDLLLSSSYAAQELGFHKVAILEKPINKNELHHTIKSLLDTFQITPNSEHNFPLIDIVSGLAKNQFTAHYQPIYNSISGAIQQLEALARWNHPSAGLVTPNQFITTLEYEGLITLLTHKIVQTSLDMLLRNEKLSKMKISINLSRKLLVDDEFIEWLIYQVNLRKIDYNQIVLEITETMAFSNSGHSLATLLRLRMKGFEISLDDFGTGHTNLEHIKNLPISELKIDRSIIKNIHKNKRSQHITSGMKNIAADLGIKMVAEGIDNAEDLKFICNNYNDINLQGYFLCKPIHSEMITENITIKDKLNS
ncbi:EAL domain-containing response regulator [Aquitalea aquatilis]|uniref:EAL domain-containing response regulator n=1 Tax=Aquitalea aquatilis TaxID=1537400 RepID=UPI0010BDE4B1|nr:EAL domain-containing response regulator [Aquitalea aquatilis]